MKFLNHFYPLEFTNTTYFLISKIWRPPSLVHLFCIPLYLAVETALKKKSFRYEDASDLLKKNSIWSPTWLTFFFTETSIADNFPIYIVQASCLSFIFDLNFQKCRFYKYMNFLIFFTPWNLLIPPFLNFKNLETPSHLFCIPLTSLQKPLF